MENMSESAIDRLWKEYGELFRDFDDLTLARWLCQTLGQLQGRAWRLSHPLVGTYRLAVPWAHNRQIWLKRLANPPAAYPAAACCRAPLLPLFTRDVLESGLICQHCGETCVPFEELPAALQPEIRAWSADYAPVHGVAHWDDSRREQAEDYDEDFEQAAEQAEGLLARAARNLVPKLLEQFPALVWEDQDECLEVRPEDVIP